jgi:rSAM/selenodomain-associated transferase 1
MGNSRKIYGIVMKFPVPGAVKSRLARDIGEAAATETYRKVAEGVLCRTRPKTGEYERIIFYSPADMRHRFGEWMPDESLSPQRGADIGEVMANAINEMFDHGAAKAVLTGTDIPGLCREIIEQAFSELDGSDVVIGPAKDGGYYLVGMKSPIPGLFRGLSWGSEKVYGETVSVIDTLGLTMSTVETLADLDTVEDLIKLGGTFNRL